LLKTPNSHESAEREVLRLARQRRTFDRNHASDNDVDE